MDCPKCRTANRQEANFCDNCGCDLSKIGANLPTAFQDPQAYTPKFLIDKILMNRSTMQGERKSVTVLFADVAGYTAMTDQLDPEQVHQVMDGCFKILMDEIHHCEGTINQFTGDGVMALFGAPIAHEDHAQRACLAALSIQEALRAYGKELKATLGADFKMRIGLNSGPVVVGSIGDDLRMDYTAIGDTTNLASRMESLARPGNILLSENTYRIVSPYFKCKSLGSPAIKGKAALVEVYQLEDKQPVYRPRLGRERQVFSEMVGRDKELNGLEFQIMKAVNGQGSIVNIIGEAGIGKSRLVAEIKNQSVMNKVGFFEARAISMGRNLSFHPIIDLLKNWAGIKEEDSEPAAFDKLRLAVTSVSAGQSDEILPFVATLMGMTLSGKYAQRVAGIEGEALEKLILKNIRDLLIGATEQVPLVIVMEDLHWADLSSLTLLESLFRLAKTHRIVFVNVFRPGYRETGERIVETVQARLPSHLVEIILKPLDEPGSETLISNMLSLPGLHHQVSQQIVKRTGGNPFFIEEVIRSLIDEGSVVLKNGAYEITDKINQAFIPQSINDLLMARIDRLEENTRDLIKIAAVIGRSFFHKILTEVAKNVDGIDQRLSYLKDIQLIRDRRRLEEIEYLFKHALAQEAAYESILIQKRKELHLKVADTIERVFSERLHEFYGMLAFHYSMGEHEDKSEAYLVKAGEEALKASGSSEALYYYQEALNLYLKKHGGAADPAKVAMLEKNIALALYNKGQYIEAIVFFEKVLAHYRVNTPKHSILVAIQFIVNFLSFLRSMYVPILKFNRLPSPRDNEISDLLFKKCTALSVTYPQKYFTETFNLFRRLSRFKINAIKDGIVKLSGCISIFIYPGLSFRLGKKISFFLKDKVDKTDAKAQCTYEEQELMRNYYEGDWSQVQEYDDSMVNRTLRMGEFFIPAAYVFWHGYLNLERGSFSAANLMTDKMADIADIYDNELARTLYYAMTAKWLIKIGKFHEALDVLDEGIAFMDKISSELWYSYLNKYKAITQVVSKDIRGAEASLQRAEEHLPLFKILPSSFMPYSIARFRLALNHLEESIKKGNRSEIAGNRKRALKTGRQMVKKSFKYTADRTEALRLMGDCFWLIGKQKKACKWWQDSIKTGNRLGAKLELSRTYMTVGKHLVDPASKYKALNGSSGEEYLEKARGMFEEMDLQYDLEELQRLYVYRAAL